MKLGIILVIIGAGDILLTLIGGAWAGFPIRVVIDIALIVWGVDRIHKHQAQHKDTDGRQAQNHQEGK